MQLGFILVLIVSIFIAIFAIQNGSPVPIDLFLARYEVPLAVVMMICLVCGAVIALALGTFRQVKKSSVNKELKNRVKTLETEKEELLKSAEAVSSELETLKNSNNILLSQIAELKSMNKEQSDTIVALRSGTTDRDASYAMETSEAAGSDLEDEKSQTAGE